MLFHWALQHWNAAHRRDEASVLSGYHGMLSAGEPGDCKGRGKCSMFNLPGRGAKKSDAGDQLKLPQLLQPLPVSVWQPAGSNKDLPHQVDDALKMQTLFRVSHLHLCQVQR